MPTTMTCVVFLSEEKPDAGLTQRDISCESDTDFQIHLATQLPDQIGAGVLANSGSLFAVRETELLFHFISQNYDDQETVQVTWNALRSAYLSGHQF